MSYAAIRETNLAEIFQDENTKTYIEKLHVFEKCESDGLNICYVFVSDEAVLILIPENSRKSGSNKIILNRYYDLDLGIFISKDPVTPDIYDPVTFNTYNYCKNNPLRYVDPLGLWHFEKGKRNGQLRTVVIADKDADPYKHLADLLDLSINDIYKWLEPYKNNNLVKEKDKFTVPNQIYFDKG